MKFEALTAKERQIKHSNTKSVLVKEKYNHKKTENGKRGIHIFASNFLSLALVHKTLLARIRAFTFDFTFLDGGHVSGAC